MKREVKKGKRDKLEEEGRKMFGKEVNEVKKVNSRMLCSMKNERGELLTKKKKRYGAVEGTFKGSPECGDLAEKGLDNCSLLSIGVGEVGNK